MSPRDELFLIIGMALVTFATRYPVLAILSKRQLPETFKLALGFVPPVVLTAIVVPAVFAPGGVIWLNLANNALVASLAAIIIAWRTKNLLATIVAGMAVYWLWGGVFLSPG
ncbi:MAG: AzlD domain-containing protein [Chloroflexota bacterium]